MFLKSILLACLLILTLGYGAANRPPSIRCPRIRSFYYADKGCSDTKVTWAPAKATDPEGGHVTIRLKSPRMSGSRFPQGTHTLVYEAADNKGLKAYCYFSFTVKVIQCNALSCIKHGATECAGRNYGHRCTFSCDPGYRIMGWSNTECQRDRTWTSPSPTCVAKECRPLDVSLIPNSKAISCTNDWKVGSICRLLCDETRGYAPVRGQFTECSLSQTWTNIPMECVDTEKPRIENCPTQTLVKLKNPRSTLTTVRWEKPITVSDNSGETIEVKSLSGVVTLKRGSFPEGTTLVRLTARDSAGNRAEMCAFNVRIHAVECDPPTFDDKYLSAPGCVDFSEGSRCHLQCYLGLKLKGRRVIECKKGTSIATKGFWSYGHDQNPQSPKPSCEVHNCPALRVPNFGALSCSGWDLGATCSLSCREGYDVPSSVGTPSIYLCDRSTSKWSTEYVPDCAWRELGGRVRMKGYYYFPGTCETAKDKIKTNFITVLNEYTHCPADNFCSVEHVDVRCGDEPEDEWWR